MYSALLETQHL